jgi:hypothetical protein
VAHVDLAQRPRVGRGRHTSNHVLCDLAAHGGDADELLPWSRGRARTSGYKGCGRGCRNLGEGRSIPSPRVPRRPAEKSEVRQHPRTPQGAPLARLAQPPRRRPRSRARRGRPDWHGPSLLHPYSTIGSSRCTISPSCLSQWSTVPSVTVPQAAAFQRRRAHRGPSTSDSRCPPRLPRRPLRQGGCPTMRPSDGAFSGGGQWPGDSDLASAPTRT